MTLAVVEPTTQILALLVETQPDNRVLLAVKETVDLGTLNANGANMFAGVHSSISVHSGDFFDGVAAYGSMLREAGLQTRQYSEVDY